MEIDPKQEKALMGMIRDMTRQHRQRESQPHRRMARLIEACSVEAAMEENVKIFARIERARRYREDMND